MVPYFDYREISGEATPLRGNDKREEIENNNDKGNVNESETEKINENEYEYEKENKKEEESEILKETENKIVQTEIHVEKEDEKEEEMKTISNKYRFKNQKNNIINNKKNIKTLGKQDQDINQTTNETKPLLVVIKKRSSFNKKKSNFQLKS
ncbi:hypothetical protein M0813_11474 [Anaeramoeba flamelloides]|uniref:Uncharacterized protein n=1 Tax=Anaeramoeba flamelloides TaxID=1746091 RepID=A0ABQ8ZEV0_9EUKA|nr:hypothetical protein M0813_11474 [Anaeramoeba flamelloides]